MKTQAINLSVGVIAAAVLAFTGVVQAQTGGGIFATVDKLLAEAEAANAELLSPANWEKAQKSYAKAKDYESKGRTDKAQKELGNTAEALNAAIDTSNLGKVNFAAVLTARDLALAAEAPKYEQELWEKAEEQFESAANSLEKGKVPAATDDGDEAKTYYSDAELAAIKTGIVGQARTLIAAAEDDRVDREAPISLDKAKAAVAQAEADLDTDRYATEGPIALAAVAEYEARHADYIADQVRRVDDKEFTIEGLILEWETPLQEIAQTLDVSDDMSAGYARSASASVAMASALMTDNEMLSARVDELEAEVSGSEAIVQETKELEAQLAAVESLFKPSEAVVVRESNDLILRLVGLSFATGESTIDTQYFGLLKKVQEAINIYPSKDIVIEGHTDSVGSDAVNSKLSQDRANAVREYLVANMGLPQSRIDAVGYGPTRPIANNDTADGRAQNRRIDVVIKGARARAANP